ncbi:UDP-N-acetylmuramate dehydrogenase [Methanosarcina sp.]|uniref:UDP-N-acetylmuramate dehydrogenase n=1 Tax=Methanosarcina sp. TaxID=2213 RepID=UPI002988FF27|nr:UDP-N-acetylmuramate dehydrogenase [Methanosarcina sp.]MDW5549228.1 UDP-N-acetylmuramate dehydrogenase [Methanosarcina sp.]MDW5553068.1 UDP-N-acetylmuramate dehydrogenase [Methanosarcina sp.]MDW5559407.1 UDP-N-acetylmuramate dehydrogenase [Methanosarcina sp.]
MDKVSSLINKNVGDIYLKEPLSKHSSWRIGGPADLLIEPYTTEQILEIVRYADLMKIPTVVIGNGTNLLFSDEGFRGIIIKMGKNFSKYTIKGNRACAEAGIWTPKFAKILSDNGLSGLEHAIGIPGTLGGLVFMNGGSGGKCIGDIVKKIWVIDKNYNLISFSKSECDFSYRKSVFQDSNYIICKIELECEAGEKENIKFEMRNILDNRKNKFPLNYPNCGSVFLSNPVVNDTFAPPGKLIEEAGLKGYQVGGAQISEKHANFIVNLGNATAKDVISIVQYALKIVYQRYGLYLESEIKYVGEMGDLKSLDEVGIIE